MIFHPDRTRHEPGEIVIDFVKARGAMRYPEFFDAVAPIRMRDPLAEFLGAATGGILGRALSQGPPLVGPRQRMAKSTRVGAPSLTPSEPSRGATMKSRSAGMPPLAESQSLTAWARRLARSRKPSSPTS